MEQERRGPSRDKLCLERREQLSEEEIDRRLEQLFKPHRGNPAMEAVRNAARRYLLGGDGAQEASS